MTGRSCGVETNVNKRKNHAKKKNQSLNQNTQLVTIAHEKREPLVLVLDNVAANDHAQAHDQIEGLRGVAQHRQRPRHSLSRFFFFFFQCVLAWHT
jgi:hypothetical protein